MEIISIDNMYEQDGIAQLELCFMSMLPSAPPQMNPGRLLAIVPEYRAADGPLAGALNRVHVLIEPKDASKEPDQVLSACGDMAAALAAFIVDYTTKAREAAYAKLDEEGPVKIVPMPPDSK